MRIYVAGPYTGDEQANTDRAAAVGLELVRMGHTPFVPHLNHYLDLAAIAAGGQRIPYAEWLRQDFEWLRLCHALLLMAPSPGADREAAAAWAIGIPVYYTLDEVRLLGGKR